MLSPEVLLRWGTATHVGRVRTENQDTFLAQPPVFVVADGMGGHRAGRDAAERVRETFSEQAWHTWVGPVELNAAIELATQRVRALAEPADGTPADGAPGSTVTGVALAWQEGPAWLVFNVGDSRTYLLRGEQLQQITVDHSHRQALVDQGWTPEQARARSGRHVITRAIGGGLRGLPRPDQWLLPTQLGDRVLLCSDGLTLELSDQLITAVLLAHPDPGDAAGELVAAATRSGGRDNVTVVVVDALQVTGGAAPDDTDLEGTVETWAAVEGHDTLPGLGRTV